MSKTSTLLMFEGRAEEAMNLYVSLVKNSEIISLSKYGPGIPGTDNFVKQAVFTLAGTEYKCIDSPIKHGFSFTPSTSIFVDCDDEQELIALFDELSKDGSILMPVSTYPFAKKFAWLIDRFGVSWQLSLA